MLGVRIPPDPLWAISQTAIAKRGAALKKPKNKNQKPRKRRECLMCGKQFWSTGVGNRRCPKCDLKIEQAANNTYYGVLVYGDIVSGRVRDRKDD